MNQFEPKKGFPFVIGAIDVCHIPIKAPRKNANDMFRTKLELWPMLGLVLIWAGPTRN